MTNRLFKHRGPITIEDNRSMIVRRYTVGKRVVPKKVKYKQKDNRGSTFGGWLSAFASFPLFLEIATNILHGTIYDF